MTHQPLEVERLLTTLARHEVRFLVIGGIAAILHGWPGATADLDVLGAYEIDNMGRLCVALGDLGAHSEGWDGSAESLRSRTAWSFETTAGPLDLLFVLEPWGTYEELAPAAAEVSGFGVAIPILSLDHLIELKQALGRPKDLRVAAELEEMRRKTGED